MRILSIRGELASSQTYVRRNNTANHQTEAKLKLQHPKSLKQLRSFMVSINHLSKFIPNAASLTDKLRPLLREENE